MSDGLKPGLIQIAELHNMLSDWSAAVPRLRELARETAALREAMLEVYNPLTRQPPDGQPHADGQGKDAQETLEGILRNQRVYSAAIARNYAESNRLQALKTVMDEAISALTDRQQEVLRMRYKGRKRWRLIAQAMHADERTVRRWERAALKNLAKNQKLPGFVRKTVI